MSATLHIKKKRFTLYLLLCLMLGLCVGGFGAAFSFYHHFFKSPNLAQQINGPSRHINRLFKHLDRHPQDHIISTKELTMFGKKTFLYLDKNEDKRLSLSELPKRRLRGWGNELLAAFNNQQTLSQKEFLQHLVTIFQQQDTNKDQQITLKEIQQGFKKRLFNKLDKDSNGALSLQEFSAHQPKRHRHHKHRDIKLNKQKRD